ncbi:E3 SUMO-protein ligase ZBED1-like [Haliotis rubra]|uniref:E3 SUMO-protein ligase ZBED1-like n=1 Tax=Haliotis rubra TaxID=36100 RepID=UPI001EE5A82F|nr:E3 SUMO-protein ligase ZBED1-like [Haliotis rubra]
MWFFISGSLKATSNFLTHLQRRHAHVLTGLKDKKRKLTDEQPSLDTFVETEKKKFSSSDSRQQKITDSITMFIARSLMPLSIVENSYFRDLLHCMGPRFVIPSRKHLTSSLITKKCEEIILAMKQDFEKTESVCVTIDLWSSRQMRGYIGITGHYISYWHLESVTLGCKQFTGRHTAENILQHYEETIATFNLSSKITNIVTDNASNMKKAFRVDLPEHQSCFAHTLQLTVHDGFGEGGQINKIIAKASNIVSHVRRSILASEILADEGKLHNST